MLHYIKQGNGPCVVLIHGFPNNHSSWDLVSPLLTKGYTYIIPDLPGAGKSAAIEQLSLAKMAKAVLEILDHEGIHEAIFIGHSMGGYTIMEATQMFPERIKAISLVHSLASNDSQEQKEARIKSIKLINNGELSKTVFLKAMSANLFSDAFKTAQPEQAKKIMANGMKLSTSALASFYEAIMHRSDKTDWLRTNKNIPIQWIIGSEDKATTMEEALKQCYLSAINEVNIYEGIGHMAMIEAPERLAKDLNNFLDFVSSRN